MASNRKHTDPAMWIAAIATERDRAAFASLFEFYAPRIKGFLMRTGSAAEVAEEIAQETMLLVWRKAALFDASRARASTWIYTIARNLRVDWLRHERTVSAATVYDVVEKDAPAQPDDEVAEPSAMRRSGRQCRRCRASKWRSSNCRFLKIRRTATSPASSASRWEPLSRDCGWRWKSCASVWKISHDDHPSSRRHDIGRVRGRHA